MTVLAADGHREARRQGCRGREVVGTWRGGQSRLDIPADGSPRASCRCAGLASTVRIRQDGTCAVHVPPQLTCSAPAALCTCCAVGPPARDVQMHDLHLPAVRCGGSAAGPATASATGRMLGLQTRVSDGESSAQRLPARGYAHTEAGSVRHPVGDCRRLGICYRGSEAQARSRARAVRRACERGREPEGMRHRDLRSAYVQSL